MTTEPPRRSRPRRRHAAAGARVVVGGLSATTALGLIGVMANAATSSATAVPAPSPATPGGASVFVAPRPGGTNAATARGAVAAPRVTVTTSPPMTTSRGS